MRNQKMARKGKDTDRENRGSNKPKQGGETHRRTHQGSNSGKPSRGGKR